jgi:5-methylcytosine-specific restriction endonuclease McrA
LVVVNTTKTNDFELDFFVQKMMTKKEGSVWKKPTERKDHRIRVEYPGCPILNSAKAKKEVANEDKFGLYQLCDLLFLFSDPLVEMQNDRKVISTSAPLETNKEYQDISRTI